MFSINQISQLNWVKTKARVIGVSVPAHSNMIYSPISSTRNGVSVLYEFDAGIHLVKGSWSSNWISTPIVKSLAPELVSAIDDLADVRIGAMPAVSAAELNTRLDTEQVVSESELSKSLRGEDFYNISAVRRKSLGGVIPAEMDAKDLPPLLTDGRLQTGLGASDALRSGQRVMRTPPEINIRFDPSDPSRSTLNYPGFNLQIPVVLLNLLLLVVTLRYFTHSYLDLKRRGY